MGLNIDENGNIYIYRGDSGTVVVTGLPTDKNYRVWFAIKDLNGKTVATRLEVYSNYSSSVSFLISSEFSKMLTIPKNEEIGFYRYGLKTIDEEGDEDTLFVGDCSYGEYNNVFVFPEKVEV